MYHLGTDKCALQLPSAAGNGFFMKRETLCVANAMSGQVPWDTHIRSLLPRGREYGAFGRFQLS